MQLILIFLDKWMLLSVKTYFRSSHLEIMRIKTEWEPVARVYIPWIQFEIAWVFVHYEFKLLIWYNFDQKKFDFWQRFCCAVPFVCLYIDWCIIMFKYYGMRPYQHYLVQNMVTEVWWAMEGWSMWNRQSHLVLKSLMLHNAGHVGWSSL